jgi:PD-(D/E)XK nuclease superfamily
VLRYNEHGGAVIRQSDLSSWARCNLQKRYRDEAEHDPTAPQGEALSATVYGTVMHYALMNMEMLWYDRRPDALEVATSTFEHYWMPEHIEAIAERVTVWLPRQTWGGMMERGRRTLRDYYAILSKDAGKLLALEYQFEVPLADVDGRQHTLTGTVDRLAMRLHYRKPYLSVEDFKTGKQPSFLRWNMQGTAYSYASTQPEFWTPTNPLMDGFDAETLAALERAFAVKGFNLHDKSGYEFPLASRRFRWLNMQEMSAGDGGWRSPRDYERLRLAAKAYVDAVEAGIYMPSLSGEVCTYCPFQRTCGGTGIAAENEGAPL